MKTLPSSLSPSPALAGVAPYCAAKPETPTDLSLDANEGFSPPDELLGILCRGGQQSLRSYPSARAVEARIAKRYGVEPERVLLTAGADSALDAALRAVLAPGRDFVLPVPTFEMIERFARFTGCRIVPVPESGGVYPVEEVLRRKSENVAAICVVTPNNPTGSVIDARGLSRLSAAFPQSLLIVDLAYGEFMDEDLMPTVLSLPNAVAIRSFSKAWGLAGLRAGFAVGQPDVVRWMRSAALPYPVSGPALMVLEECLAQGAEPVQEYAAQIRVRREALRGLFAELGIGSSPSQANFVLASFPDSRWMREALAGFGIAVRAFPGREGLENSLRITCPGEEKSFRRLESAVRTILRPETILFDLDGVLADVSASYRAAISATAAAYGITISEADILNAKLGGNANNDWELTRRLLQVRGVEASLADVKLRFEEIYQGSATRRGLKENEQLIPSREWLAALATKIPLAIVTGRPRRDAEEFLERSGVRGYFRALVCMEDAPVKPLPDPLLRAQKLLGCERAWMIGDTPDDMAAARAARVLPLGICAPSDRDRASRGALLAAGAGRVLEELQELDTLLSSASAQPELIALPKGAEDVR